MVRPSDSQVPHMTPATSTYSMMARNWASLTSMASPPSALLTFHAAASSARVLAVVDAGRAIPQDLDDGLPGIGGPRPPGAGFFGPFFFLTLPPRGSRGPGAGPAAPLGPVRRRAAPAW